MSPPTKIDICAFLTEFGRETAFFNWREHLAGYDDFSIESKLIEITSLDASYTLYSPRNRSYALEIIEDEDADYACDFDGGVDYPISDFDVNACRLNEERFAAWLAKLLDPSNRYKPQWLNEYACELTPLPIPVYLILPCELECLEHFLNERAQGGTAMVLCASPNDLASTCMVELQRFHPNLILHSLLDLIGLRDDTKRYTYIYKEKFTDYLHSFAPSPPASFLPRPPKATWANLTLIIKTSDKYALGTQKDDELIAKYTIKGSKENYYKKELVSKIKGLKGRGGKRDARYLRLCELAQSGGLYSSSPEKMKSISDLRTLLRDMFGYAKHEDPIPNETGNNTHAQCAFTIKFSDSQSDPLNRRASLSRFKERVDYDVEEELDL